MGRGLLRSSPRGRGLPAGAVPGVGSVGQPRPSRPGSAFSLQDLLGLLLLFSLAANVAQGAEVRGLRSRGGVDEVQCRRTHVGEFRSPCPPPPPPDVIVGSPYSSAHPREQKLEPLRGLMSCLSSGLRPAPQRSGRGLLCRTPTAAAQTAGALKI